ncbi:hypothetical protein GGR51DRAFT_371967 [Nemania sp. FL0031]|nr:hypothetical protein GGR51DRAFT_371967 [Nemania sp. FL0031]
MALRPSLLQFLIWASSIPIASSNYVGLGGDIASLVPTCAQSCLLSFIRSNYPTTDCGTSFTLPCLCPVQSISGFTVGEAALQCLLGDLQLGQCGEQDVNDAAPARVLHMCSGQKSALPNTHATLTATLVIPPSGAPSLLPPTTSKTMALTSSTTTSTRTTLRTSSTTPSLTITSSSSIHTSTSVSSSSSSILTSTSESSFPVSTTTSTPAFTPTPSTTSEPSATTRLAPAQIAGISVGVVGAVAIAAGAIVLARCMRRRRYPDAESEKGFFENNNSIGSFDPSSARGSRVFHISPPLLRTSKYRPEFGPRPPPPPPAPQVLQPERPVQPANMDRNTIGLAISRPRSLIPQKLTPKIHSPAMSSPRPVEVPLERKPSKLLPPRPALTLEIPSKTAVASETSSQGPPTKDRASTMTNMTAFADLDSEAAEGGLTWRPPSTDPLSATRLYVADKYGNWVLNNDNRRSQIAQVVEAAELDTYTPLTKSPIEKQEEAAQMAAAISASTALPQPAFLSRDPANWTNSQSSSLYSQASAARQTGRRNSSGRNSASRYRKSNHGSMMNRSDSKASVTTIQTSSTGGNDDGSAYDDIARLSQLSPVQESPAPASGRARVTYPKIPGRLGGATIRYVPPPKRPDFASLPSQQPSPTLGVYPIEGSPSAYPPPLNPRRSGRGFAPMQRTGSGFTPEPPNVEVFPLQNFARPNKTSGPGPYPKPDSAPMQPAGSYRYPYPQQQEPPRTPPQQQSIPTFTPSPLSEEKKPPTPPKSRLIDRGRPSIASQRVASGTSFATVSSTASSLLAKRLGIDRAAAFALDPNAERAQQWKRRGDGLLSPDLASPRGTLPQTPIWQPKLTPTRRGGDLYLNVQ